MLKIGQKVMLKTRKEMKSSEMMGFAEDSLSSVEVTIRSILDNRTSKAYSFFKIMECPRNFWYCSDYISTAPRTPEEFYLNILLEI